MRLTFFLIYFLSLSSLYSCPSPESERSLDLENKIFRDSVFTSLEIALLNVENVYNLNLNFKEISEFPLEIIKFQNLESLNLGGNKLTSLPPEISELLNLKKLKLYNNKLESLPSEIGKMKNLEELDVANNQLTRLPSKISNLNTLKHLNISGNTNILNLPKGFWKLNLEVLIFENDNIDELPKEFLEMSRLNFTLSSYGQFLVGNLSEGKRVFCKNGKMGVIESSGKMVITPYDCLDYSLGGEYLPKYRNNRCFIFEKTNEGTEKMGIMNEDYTLIEAAIYLVDGFNCNQYFDFKNNLYPLFIKSEYDTEIAAHWEFINTNYEKVFEFKYGSGSCTAACVFMPEFAEGLCLFEDSVNKYGYIDTLGEIVIANQYFGASNFSEGIACVIQMKDSKHFYFSFIDKKGEKIFDRNFDIHPFSEPFPSPKKTGYHEVRFDLYNQIGCGMRSFLFEKGKCKLRFWDSKKKQTIEAIINTRGEIIEYTGE